MISATNSSTQSSASAGDSQASAFRNADFLKIMLSELAHQDPLAPQETSKIVENMQKLQDLANTQFTKFRGDLSWAQQLMGKSVNVQQSMISAGEKQKLIDQGLNPDVGFGSVKGEVSSFRQIKETVYVTIADHDYPIDNVKQVLPQHNNPDTLSNLAANLLGKTVGYKLDDGTLGKGQVTNVAYDTAGELVLNIGGLAIPYANMVQIGT